MSATAEALAIFDPFDRHPSRRKTYAQIAQALERLEITDPDKPKLPVFFKDGPAQFSGYVAFWEEPPQRIVCERPTEYGFDSEGRIYELGAETFAYVYVGTRDGVAHYELEVAHG